MHRLARAGGRRRGLRPGRLARLGFAAGLRGVHRRGPVPLFDAAATAAILFPGFGPLTLT